MADKERLQFGREKRPGRSKPPVDPNASRFERLITRHKRRRAAKKRRLAAMTRTKRVWRRIGILATWVLALFTLTLVAAVSLFYVLSDVPRPETLPLLQTAVIQYADGSTLAKIGTENRTIVSLDQVPVPVRWDVVAAEDRKFYSEPGFSITGTMRAVLSDVTGGDTQGGSGITQQYAKNAYLNDSRTLTRKLKELMIAVKLARQYSKDQILEFYLNTVYFGRGAYGIEAAAQTYFGVDVSKLTVAQGAVLAAGLRAPSFYDPAVNPTDARARWHYVIDGMVTIHKLTQAQANALTYPNTLPPKDTTQLGVSGPKQLIVAQVLAELRADGISQTEINDRGLVIRTTIDKKAQADAESAIQQAYAHPTKKQANLKNALVAVNPSSGAVLAYYGGSNGTGLDYAQAWRQPGSTFKPYVLATALVQNLQNKKPAYTINSVFDGSSPQTVDGFKIHNDPTDPSSGHYTLRQAMTLSLNTVFYRLASLVGPDNVAKLAHAAGIATIETKTGPNAGSTTLQDANGHVGDKIGIGGYEVRPLDLAVGYSTFANGGTANGAYFVQQVKAANGALVFTHKDAGTKALDPKVANDVTLSMEQVASSSRIGLDGGRQVAAKTGTAAIANTSDSSDAWTVGFTPQVVAASWAGSNTTGPIYDDAGFPMYGRENPGQAWQLFMNAYLANKPVLPLATKQMVGAIAVIKPTTTPSRTATSTSPTPTFSITTTFGSAPPPTNPSTTPVSGSPSSTPSVSCTPVLLGQNCTTVPAGG